MLNSWSIYDYIHQLQATSITSGHLNALDAWRFFFDALHPNRGG